MDIPEYYCLRNGDLNLSIKDRPKPCLAIQYARQGTLPWCIDTIYQEDVYADYDEWRVVLGGVAFRGKVKYSDWFVFNDDPGNPNIRVMNYQLFESLYKDYPTIVHPWKPWAVLQEVFPLPNPNSVVNHE